MKLDTYAYIMTFFAIILLAYVFFMEPQDETANDICEQITLNPEATLSKDLYFNQDVCKYPVGSNADGTIMYKYTYLIGLGVK